MYAQSKPFVVTLLGAVCIHAAAFSLTWEWLNDSELEPKSSVTGNTTIVLSQATSTPVNQQANESTAKNTINDNLIPTKSVSDFEPYKPTNVAQLEADITALIEPTVKLSLKTQAKTIIVKEAIQAALKITPVFEPPAKAKSVKKVEIKKTPRGSVLPPLEGEHIEGEHAVPKQSSEKKIETIQTIKAIPLTRPVNRSSETKLVNRKYALVLANNNGSSRNQPAVNSAPNTVAADVSLAMKNYYSELGSWLAKHKKYPRRARQRKQEGSALLYFVVDRNGRILEHSVAESSGYKLLDKEVSAMLKRAEPLPKIPNLMHQAKLKIMVPIEFSLR